MQVTNRSLDKTNIEVVDGQDLSFDRLPGHQAEVNLAQHASVLLRCRQVSLKTRLRAGHLEVHPRAQVSAGAETRNCQDNDLILSNTQEIANDSRCGPVPSR